MPQIDDYPVCGGDGSVARFRNNLTDSKAIIRLARGYINAIGNSLSIRILYTNRFVTVSFKEYRAYYRNAYNLHYQEVL